MQSAPVCPDRLARGGDSGLPVRSYKVRLARTDVVPGGGETRVQTAVRCFRVLTQTFGFRGYPRPALYSPFFVETRFDLFRRLMEKARRTNHRRTSRRPGV